MSMAHQYFAATQQPRFNLGLPNKQD